MAVNQEELCNAIVELVTATHGKKNLKPMDVTKAMIEQFGEDNVDKSMCKKALRSLMDSGRCTYKYAGGSYVTLPEN